MFKFNNGKRVVFYTITALLPFIALALLEMGLRLFSFGEALPLFVQSPEPNYLYANPTVGKRFFSENEYTAPLNDLFLKDKPANGYRIFVLGESTVLGFPYDANVAFTRILQRRLQDIFPDRTIEVINLGMTAVTTYTLLDFADELLRRQPDAVLIYAGHNEYYGALGVASMEKGSIPAWLKKLQLKVIHVRTYQLLQLCVGKVYQFIAPMSADEAKGTLMQRLVGKNLIPYNSPIYKEGLEQFSDNMSELLSKMKNAGVPVIISDLVSNVRDLHPFYSSRYEQYPDAESLYTNARALEAASQFEQAKEEYSKAKDLDLIRFRASEDLNNSIVRLADSFGAHYISLKTEFEAYSPHGIVGDNLMMEHLHPNIDGYFLMSEGFLNAMKKYHMVENEWDSARIKPWEYYRNNWGFTELDSMIAVLRIKHLKSGWPFKPDTTVNNFLFTYTPNNIIDSLAFMRVKYDNVTSEMVHRQLAHYYESRNEFGRASKEYLSIAYSVPSYAAAFYFAADFAFKGKEYANAIRYFKESPSPDTSSYVQFTLASYYYTQKQLKQALQCIRRSEQLKMNENNYYQIQKLKYQIEKDSGLSDEAAATLALLKKINPSFQKSSRVPSIPIMIPQTIRPYIEQAEGLRKMGRLSEAVTVLKQANAIREMPYTNLLIGKILFTQKDSRALEYFEKAQKEMKGDPSISFALCVLYFNKGEMDKAREALKDLSGIVGDHDSQVELLKMLLQKGTKHEKGLR